MNTHPAFQRRTLLLAAAALGLHSSAHASELVPRKLVFPRDHGAHNNTGTEWWYLTGQGEASDGRLYGFQVTFFRSRVPTTQDLKSRLAAKQLLFAHAAITDVQGKRLWHEQRIARWNGDPQFCESPAQLAGAVCASTADMSVALRDWSLKRHSGGQYQAVVKGEHLSIEVMASPKQATLLQGDQGFSRKGPSASQSSFYVSHPQLGVTGRLTVEGRTLNLQAGRAWMDHEWSEALMHPDAVGWDWIGMNLNNGDSLTAFRMRRADGSSLWAGGSWRSGQNGHDPLAGQTFSHEQVHFEPLRFWVSPATQTRYPVAWRVSTPAGTFTVQALVDAQELNSQQSTGTVYWEGLSELQNTQGQAIGRGYLEMTGYGQRLKL